MPPIENSQVGYILVKVIPEVKKKPVIINSVVYLRESRDPKKWRERASVFSFVTDNTPQDPKAFPTQPIDPERMKNKV